MGPLVGIEGVRGPCVVNHVEEQQTLGAQSCPTNQLKELGSHDHLLTAPGKSNQFLKNYPFSLQNGS